MPDQLLALQTEYLPSKFLNDKYLYRLANGIYVFSEETWEKGCYFPEKCVHSKDWTTLISMFSPNHEIRIYPSKEMNLIIQGLDESKVQIQAREVFVSLDLDRFVHNPK